MTEKKFRGVVDATLHEVGYMTEEQTAQFAAEVLAVSGANRNVVGEFLKHLGDEREEFVSQVESLSREDD